MDLWDKFKKLNPHWDRFRFLSPLKQMIYSFLPIAEKMAIEYDKNDGILVYLDSKLTWLREINKKSGRDIDKALAPAQKIALGLISADPAWRNLAVAFIASIRYGDVPPLTLKMKAWLRHKYGLDIP